MMGLVFAAAPSGDDQFSLYLLYGLFFTGTLAFLLVGFQLFRRGWRGYQEEYLEDAEQTLESMFLSVSPEQLLYVRIACFFVSYLAVYLLTQGPIFSAIVGVLFSLLPDLLLRLLKRLRLRKFNEQLVDALSTMSNSLKSGSSLPMAFDLIHSDLPDPIAQEFGIVVQELRLGIPTEEALRNLLKRMPSPELDLLVTSIIIAQDVGGNLTEVFDNISNVIRERTRIEGRIRSLTAQGKMQSYVVVALPPLIGGVMYMIDPSLITPLFTTVIGYVIIGVMVVMSVIGFAIIRKIVAIDI